MIDGSGNVVLQEQTNAAPSLRARLLHMLAELKELSVEDIAQKTTSTLEQVTPLLKEVKALFISSSVNDRLKRTIICVFLRLKKLHLKSGGRVRWKQMATQERIVPRSKNTLMGPLEGLQDETFRNR
jgi:hypothetical protein